jgi:hypothetical protein
MTVSLVLKTSSRETNYCILTTIDVNFSCIDDEQQKIDIDCKQNDKGNIDRLVIKERERERERGKERNTSKEDKQERKDSERRKY